MRKYNDIRSLEISKEVLSKWQGVVDIMAELLNVPAGLIMRIRESDIEVFVASNSKDNPYHPGDKEHLVGSGLYCETVIKTKDKLLIPNATTDEKWKANPDIKLGMMSYLGFPLLFPTGDVFGTICVLDNKENVFSEVYERLILEFKELVESHLSILSKSQALELANKELADRLSEIRVLRGMLPICSACKKNFQIFSLNFFLERNTLSLISVCTQTFLKKNCCGFALKAEVMIWQGKARKLKLQAGNSIGKP